MSSSSKMKDWDMNTLLKWVNNLPSDQYDQSKKDQIINGIEKFKATGDDIWNAESDDLKDALEINGLLAKRLAKSIAKQRKDELPTNIVNNINNSASNNNNDVPFTLNINGSIPTKLKDIKASYTIGEIKKLYLDQHGVTITPEKMKGVNIKFLGNPLNDENRSLQSYGIINGDGFQLFVSYNLNGGMAQSLNDDKKDDDDPDEYRFRKIRHKKYKSIQLSSLPDCIFGHSDVKRAQMPCGCSMAADTMFNYMKSVFDKNMRALKYLQCPQLKNKCKGSDIQRQWQWPLVFQVADLSDREITKYSLIIQNRISGTKQCPHCSALCERPSSVKIWRVNCSNCSNSDWCFQCSKLWKGSGKYYVTLCGNSGCVADSLMLCLKNTKWVIPKYGWSNNQQVPTMRACPNCLTLIEYKDECQHMICVRCAHEFCFKCLAKYDKNNGGYTCDYSTCPIAKIQTFN